MYNGNNLQAPRLPADNPAEGQSSQGDNGGEPTGAQNPGGRGAAHGGAG